MFNATDTATISFTNPERQAIVEEALSAALTPYVRTEPLAREIKLAGMDLFSNRINWKTFSGTNRLGRTMTSNVSTYMEAFGGRGVSEQEIAVSLLKNPQTLCAPHSKTQKLLHRMQETSARLLAYPQLALKEKDTFFLYMNNSRYLTYLPARIEEQIVLFLGFLGSPFVQLQTDREYQNAPSIKRKNRLTLAFNEKVSTTELLARMTLCEFALGNGYGGRKTRATDPYFVLPRDSHHSRTRSRGQIEKEIAQRLKAPVETLIETQTVKGQPKRKIRKALVLPDEQLLFDLKGEKGKLAESLGAFLAEQRQSFRREPLPWPNQPHDWRDEQSVLSLLNRDGAEGFPKTEEGRFFLATRLSLSGLLSYDLIARSDLEKRKRQPSANLSTSL